MSRREFPTRVRVQAFDRANGRCEECGIYLQAGRVEYHHRIPDALGGEPTLENCICLCKPCHAVSTRSIDVPQIAKMKRQRAAHLGAKAPSRNPLPGGKRSAWKKKLDGRTVPR